MYVWYHTKTGTQIWKAIDMVGLSAINAKENKLEDIIDGMYFQNVIPESWDKPSCAEGKLSVCAKVCGKYDAFKEQFK
jgi:hypothetical protein